MIVEYAVALFTLFLSIKSQKPNILIIHGFTGVRLEAKLDKPSAIHWYCSKKSNWYTIFLEPISDTVSKDCFNDNMRLIYDPIQDKMINPEGVEIRPYGEFGDTEGLEILSSTFQWKTYYMKQLIDELVLNAGYTRKVNIFAAAYDFRIVGDKRDMNIYYNKLGIFIEKTWNINKNKFIIVTHSMGAPLTSRFLVSKTDAWKDQYIHSWYSISGAFGGAYGALPVHLSAYAFSLIKNLLPMPIEEKVAVSWPSTYFLLPDESISIPERVVISTQNGNFTFNQLKDLIIQTDTSNVSKIFSHIPSNYLKTAPRVKMVCAYTLGSETFSGLQYKGLLGISEYKNTFEDGDGTVTAESLRLCHTWNSTNVKPITFELFDKLGHASILHSTEFLNRFIQYIKSQV